MNAKHKRNWIKRIIGVFSISLLFGILILFIAFFSVYYSVEINHKNINKSNGKILIYDNSGNEINLPSLNTYAPYEEINQHIINAFIALEDKRFYNHKGIDYIRVMGAVKNNIKYGYIKEGGSTITQQLAKNTQLDSKKTIHRKIKEAKLASDIERLYSKEEIMEMYLNAIYFGNGIYGINQACRQIFNKSPMDIEIFEAAILAGIVKNPNKNSPLKHPQNSNTRKNIVLNLMQQQGYITKSEYDVALKQEFIMPKLINNNNNFTPYYNAVINQACHILGVNPKALKEQGIKIETFVDISTQELIANAFISEQFKCNSSHTPPDYSVLILDNHTGGVKTYYATHNHNPYELRRQPGSTLKPILVYAPAFEKKKITTASLFLDKKVNFGDYTPSNYMNKYQGIIDVRKAIMDSSNTVAVKVLKQSGIAFSKNIASKMGITFAPQDNYLPIALGGMTQGVTNLKLAEAYMCLANNGMHLAPTFIKSIKDINGRILYQHIPAPEKALSNRSAYLITDILTDTAKNGTAKKLNSLRMPIAAKTGTVGENETRLNSDAWSISYTTDTTACVWYGNLTGDKSNNFSSTGGTLPTLFSRYIHQNIKDSPSPFAIPDGIIELSLDKMAIEDYNMILLASPMTPKEFIKKELFDVDNCPDEYSTLFVMPSTNLTVELDENFCSKITFDAMPTFSYKIIKKNIISGQTQIIYSTNCDDGTITISDYTRDDENGIISYSIEVQNKYCSLGISEEKYMILNIPITKSIK